MASRSGNHALTTMDGMPTAERLEVAAVVPPVGRLLDVGCHEGRFGEVIAARGAEVWGIEPDEDRATVAASRLHRVVVGSYPQDFPPEERFDCIVFNDVLEHMPDPQSALTAAKRQLAPNGCIVASIPNVRHVSVVTSLALRGRWDYQDWGILDRTHLRFFTKATMKELFQRSGLQVERQEPSTWGRARGKRRILALLGKRSEEFLAVQYLIVARPDD